MLVSVCDVHYVNVYKLSLRLCEMLWSQQDVAFSDVTLTAMLALATTSDGVDTKGYITAKGVVVNTFYRRYRGFYEWIVALHF